MSGKTLSSIWQKIVLRWPELPGILILAAILAPLFAMAGALGVQP